MWTKGRGFLDVRPPGVRHSRGIHINNAGQMVGAFANEDAPQILRAFVWSKAHGFLELPGLGSNFTRVTSINDAGIIVGQARSPLDGRMHMVMWQVRGG
ncbi:MAG TPA: hypothetical protein VMN60_10760 [Longimicrobiales bacterium]|nr:hypothetical protein [Longimicrobiales bacterium]